MTLTVLIPTVGRPSLPHAARSVELQTAPTGLIVESDPDRTGCGPTLNRMLPLVQTPWLSTMGDDDMLGPHYTERFLAQDLDALDMVIFQMRYADGRVLPTVTEPSALMHGNVGATYIVRTDLVREVGGWIKEPSRPFLAEDWEMIAAVRALGARIRIVHEIHYHVGAAEAAAA